MTEQEALQIDPNALPQLTDDELISLWETLLRLASDNHVALMAHVAEECHNRGLKLKIDLNIGHIDFAIAPEDELLMRNPSDDPWVPAPDEARDNYSYVCAYGQSFRGYEYAEKIGVDLPTHWKECRATFHNSGKWQGEFITLRLALYASWRSVHFCGFYEEDWKEIRSLFHAVCAAYTSQIEEHHQKLAVFNRELDRRLAASDSGETIPAEEV